MDLRGAKASPSRLSQIALILATVGTKRKGKEAEDKKENIKDIEEPRNAESNTKGIQSVLHAKGSQTGEKAE